MKIKSNWIVDILNTVDGVGCGNIKEKTSFDLFEALFLFIIIVALSPILIICSIMDKINGLVVFERESK